MTIPKGGRDETAKRRKRAEEIVRREAPPSSRDATAMSLEETQRMLHELQVHQIELELQNEELRAAQAERDAAGVRYFEFYDLAPVGYVTLSEEGLILEANLTAASLLGVTRAALIEQRFTQFILPEDQDKLYRHGKKLIAAGESRAWELRMVKQDGTSFWARSEEIAVPDAHGAVVRRLVLSDVTERKRIEEFQTFLAQTSSRPNHEPFFSALARYLAQSLDMDFVCIDRLEGEGLTARTVAVWCDGHFEDNVTYALKDTPCGDVAGKTVCCFPASVCQFFPRDQVLQDLRAESYIGVTIWSYTGQPIGLIAVIGRAPLANRQLAEVILKLAAVRAAGELERQEAEDALRASEARYTRTLHAVNDGLWDWHIPSGNAFFSALYYTMLGYQNGEFPATYDAWRLLVHPEDIDRVERDLRASVETGNGFSIDLRMRKKDGQWLWVSTRGKMIERDADGKALRMAGILSDITERKRAEEALRRNQAMLSRTERIAQVGSWEWDVATDTVTWSDEMFRIFQRNPAEGAPSWAEHPAHYHPEDMQRLRVAVEAAISNGTPYALELRVLRKDGETRVCLARGQTEMGPGKRASRLFGSFQDITERKRAEGELVNLETQNRQLQKAESLSRMAGAIAHHFNNQLQAVMMNLEMAMSDLPRDAVTVESLTEAMQSARKAAEVSSLMLTYLGQTDAKREPLDFSDVCQRYVPLLRASLPQSVVLETAWPSSGPTLRANASQIQQVLNNLVANAWEAMGDARRAIHLTIKTVPAVDIPATHRFPSDWQPPDPAYGCLEVMDTGCGIPARDFEKIFDPFFSTKFTGRGMGLAVVLGIVRSYQGGITVASEPGRGSVFRVFLPLSTEAVSRKPVPLTQAPQTAGSGTVLVVDDEPSLRLALTTAIQRLGFAVLAAQDGVEALEIFQRHRDEIRCVLCDLSMPRMNGWETLTALRQLAPGVPVILCSGYGEAQMMAGHHPEVPQAFLSKPFNYMELIGAISQVLANTKASERVT